MCKDLRAAVVERMDMKSLAKELGPNVEMTLTAKLKVSDQNHANAGVTGDCPGFTLGSLD